MKKLIVLGVTLLLMVAFSSAAMAYTLGVNVEKGFSVLLEQQTESWLFNWGSDYGYESVAYPILLKFNWGVTDSVYLSLAYRPEGDTRVTVDGEGGETALYNVTFYAYTYLGFRYEFVENVAFGADYGLTEGGSSTELYLRAKVDFTDSFALAGELSNETYDLEDSAYYPDILKLLVQGEFAFTESFIGNLGLASYTYNYDSSDESYTFYIIGAELRLTNFGLYFQYELETEGDYSLSKIGAVYSF